MVDKLLIKSTIILYNKLVLVFYKIPYSFKEYLKLLNRLYDITCSTISNIPYNLIFTTKF